MYLAAALMTPNTTFQLECSACGRDYRTCPTDNVLSTDHIHVPCTLLFAHVAHSSREDIHVHVKSEGEEAGGVVADHSKGQDTRQSTIAIQTEVDEDAITVSWQVPRTNGCRWSPHSAPTQHQIHPVLGEGGGRG